MGERSRSAMTLDALAARRPGSAWWAIGGMVALLAVGLNRPGRRVRFVVQGWERVPKTPVLLVSNHTHLLDWVALRWVGYWRGRTLCNWVKPRTYEEGMAGFLDLTGNVPVVSRGYLLSADARMVHGRPPDEVEYRVLRDHLDVGEPLPDTPFFDALQQRPRDILGLPFDPAQATYREAMESLFHQMMDHTVAHTRGLSARGIDLSIMPQGVTSRRLTAGHPGAVQAALALGLPLVPIGVSGFPDCFEGKHWFPRHAGTVTVRVGEPWRLDPIDGHTPFLPSSERAHAAALEAATADMMERINALLDPEHQWAEEGAEGDVTGVSRFV